jgi:catechol-2,3-dioxygenase
MNIETLELCSRDLVLQSKFYAEVLGLQCAPVEDVLTIAAGVTTLVFRERRDLESRYHFAFNIPENRIAEAICWLASRGVALIPDESGETVHEFKDWNALAIYFFDADGNILEFIARHELANGVSQGQPFSAGEILNLSEIGVSSPNVIETARQLRDEFGLIPYRQVGEAFGPVGDANGMFILVPSGRIWYPNTSVPAKQLPLRMAFRNDLGRRFVFDQWDT